MESDYLSRPASDLVVKRARGYRVYDTRGRRFLDMDLNGGRALLGHNPPGLASVMKNALERGILAEYPSVYAGRLVKGLSLLFPGYREFRLFSTPERAETAIGGLVDGAIRSREIPDPGLEDVSGGTVSLWRPFAEYVGKPAALIPILPFPAAFAPTVVCFSGGEAPESDPVSPVLLAALCRIVHDVLAVSSAVRQADWERFESDLWTRRGPYLRMECPRERYAEVCGRFFDRGILLPPAYPGPAIIPAEMSCGERTKVAGTARELCKEIM